MRVVVLNGPNLDLLGSREPEVYGTTTLSALQAQIADWARKLGIETVFAQSNHEGDLIEAIHDAATSDGIVINPGALTHTSRAIGDAVRSVGVPTVEVHISNVKERDPWRAISLLSDACVRTIYGRGFPGYRDALRHLANRAAMPMLIRRYGPHPDNLADLRMPDTVPSGLAVLIHGGFWLRQYERDSMETMAVDLAGRGIATLNVEYRRLGTGGGWPGSSQDVQTALRWKSSHPDLTGLATAIIGHSAGGHLTAMLMCALFPAFDRALPKDLWKGGLAISGLYDLRPLLSVDWLNGDLRLDAQSALKLSPAFMPRATRAPVMTCVGGGESSEFLRQNALLGSRWRAGFAGDIPMPGKHHFSVMDGLADPKSALFAGARRLMKLDR